MEKKKETTQVFNSTLQLNAKLPAHIKTTEHIASALNISIAQNLPALLIGETGTGKTATIRAMADQVGAELIRVNLSGSTGVDELLGKWLANEKGLYWQDGEIIRAMRTGAWLVLDEINACLPEVLFVLHSLLDDERAIYLKEKDGEKVTPHENCRFFATMNPPEDYAGTKELNKALLSRFPLVLFIDYSEKEKDIIKEQAGTNNETAKKLVKIGQELRRAKENGIINLTCSTRDLINAGRLTLAGLSIKDASILAITNKANQDERAPINKILELLTGEKITAPTIENPARSFKDLDEVKKALDDMETTNKESQERVDNYEEQARNARGQLSNANTFVYQLERIIIDKKIAKKEKDTILESLNKLRNDFLC